jgi:hypothetical protein
MNAAALKTAGRYLGRWSAIVFFVLLLTLIFSFLGTIICAVLAGMMFGATKHVRWQALLISLIFPGAIFALLRAGRAPLLDRQILVLGLLCFGAFWLTYAVAAAVVYFEASAGSSSAPAGPGEKLPAPALEVAEHRLSLGELQGTWSCPVSGCNGEARARELEINTAALLLRVRDRRGQIRSIARADLAQDDSSRIILSPGPAESAEFLVSI